MTQTTTPQPLTISINDIIERSIHQCSQDFRGLRTQKPDIDLIYEDFALTMDDAEAMTKEIYNTAALVYQRLRGYITDWGVTPDVTYTINTERNLTGLETLAVDIFVYSVLAWWYETRMPDLATSYAMKGAERLDSFYSAVTPKFAERRLRMF